ncbi:MAG: peroxidase [Pseudomonadota bacterium]
MTFIQTLTPEQAPADVRDMYQRQESHWGYIPQYAKIFSHRPEALARWGRLLAELRRYTNDRRFELVSFVVAFELRSSGCSLAHGEKLAEMIGTERVLAIASANAEKVLPLTDLAIVRFCQRLAQDPTAVTAEEVDTLRAEHGLSDAEVFDIAALAAGRCFFTTLLDGLGCHPEAAFLDMNETLREALTKGRPFIDSAAGVG